MLAQFKLWKLKLWGIVQFQVHTYVAILCMPTELRLIRAYHGYDYGRPRQQLRAYYCYGYRRSTATGTGVVLLRVRAYYCYGYGRTTATGTGVLRLWLRAYYDYGYGRTTTEATGGRTGVLRILFTAYTVLASPSSCSSKKMAKQTCKIWAWHVQPLSVLTCHTCVGTNYQ